jgi:hypothetical protein
MRYGRGAGALLLGLPRLRRLGLYTAPPTLWSQLRRARPWIEEITVPV